MDKAALHYNLANAKRELGQPQEAARVARELVTSENCEFLLDAEASSGAFAVHEVARDLGVLVMHSVSETSSLSADPKVRTPLGFRCARQGIHDAIVGGAYAAQIAKAKNSTPNPRLSG